MKSEYDKIAHFYDDHLFFQHEKTYFNKFIQFISQQFLINDGLKILDIACGTGNSIASFEDRHTCYGIDISTKMLNIARSKLKNTQLHLSDFRSFKLNEKFDIILCLFDSLNHTKEISLVFKSVRKHLKEDGFFIFDYYTKYGLDVCIASNTTNINVQKNKGSEYKWNINIEKTISSITEYVLPMKEFSSVISTFFKFDLFDQNFNALSLDSINSDSLILKNQIERIIVVAKLK